MSKIHEGPITEPSAWTAAELGGKAGLERRLSAAEPAALGRLAAKLRGREPPAIAKADVDDPQVIGLMAEVRRGVMEGRGAVILTGLPLPDEADFRRLFWALGTHVGDGVVQSFREDYVATVENNPNLPYRGTTRDVELRAHTDFHEVMALASISKAESGGLSGLVSSLAVHNEIWRTRPELLAPLYEGWWNVSPLHRERSAEKVPIFCDVGGKVSCFYNRVFYAGPDDGAPPMPAKLKEAMALFDAIAARPDIRAEFMLEPGEMVFWHNLQVCHARTAFKDTDAHRRRLLRLWLNVPDGRPMDERIKARARITDQDHVAGREPALASS